MASETVHCVVLRRRDSGETDRRLTLLTREQGVIDAVARGARKSGSRLSGMSEPLSVSVLQLAAGRATRFVTQAQPLSSFPLLRTDYERLSAGLALAEIAAAVLPHGQPAESEFEMLVTSLRHLEIHEKPLVAFLWAQVKMLETAGFHPSFGTCAHTGVRVAEAFGWFSPTGGGYLCESEGLRYNDRYLVRAEALLGLAALAPLDEPPKNIRFSVEAARALFPFWRSVADRQLPANESFVAELVVG